MSRQKNKVISDTSGDEDKKSRSKSNKSEKKSVKKKSRHANGSSFGSKCDMPSKSNGKTKESRIGGYIDEENAAEYEGDMNSHHSQTRRKRDRLLFPRHPPLVTGSMPVAHRKCCCTQTAGV